MNAIIITIYYAIIVSFLSFAITFKLYRTIKHEVVLSNILLIFWIIFAYIGRLQKDTDIAITFSRVSIVSLTLSFVLSQYHYNEITANFGQRKTMTIGTGILGSILALLLFPNMISYTFGEEVILANILLIAMMFSSGFFAYRFFMHARNQNTLSYHYALYSRFRILMIRYGILIISLFFIIGATVYLVLEIPLTSMFYVLTSTGMFILSYILYNDPLMATDVGQKIQAVALLSSNKTKFLTVLASDGESVAQDEEFSSFLHSINTLLLEMSKSQTRVEAFSTNDVLIMFEKCGDDTLIFILEYRAPILKRIIHKLSKEIIQSNVQTQEEFTEIVELSLLRTRLHLGIISKVDKSWVVVTNERSASYNRAKEEYDIYLQRCTVIQVQEFNAQWIKEHKPSHILAMGGDGTVHYVANQIIYSEMNVPIAVLPGGGGNDIARRWKEIHSHYEEINDIRYIDMDVFKLMHNEETYYAINTIEWGVGAPTAQLREDNHGKMLFGTAKYFYLVLKALKSFYPWQAEIEYDDSKLIFEKLSALIVGWGNSTIGGGFKLFPEEFGKYHDSFFMFAQDYTKFAGVKLMWKLLKSSHYSEDNIDYRQFNEKLSLYPNQKIVVKLTIDGEIKHEPPTDITILKNGIKTFTII